MVLISLAIATVISMATKALILSNGEISEVIPAEKKLQIVSQNESHIYQ
jgi:ABC-type glutathione transport system ATPase component